MGPAPVVIELDAADARAPEVGALIDACRSGVSGGDCRLGESAGEVPRAVAIVRWQNGHRRASIEIGIRRGGADHWSTREIAFSDADPDVERWRSVGLVIGAIIGEEERAAETPKPAPERPVPPADATKAADRDAGVARPSRRKPALATALEAELDAGPAFDDGTWRTGVGVGILFDLGPVFIAGARARYRFRSEDERTLSARWLGLALGGGAHFDPVPALRLEGRAEGVLEHLETSISGPRADSAGRFMFGARAIADAVLELSPPLSAVVGGELTRSTNGTFITVDAARLTRAPPLSWDAFIGIRLALGKR